MTVNGKKNKIEQGNIRKSANCSKRKRGFKTSLKTSKRKTFKQAWDNAVLKAKEQRAKRHYSLTSNQAFNKLLDFFGHNYFEVITKKNTPHDTWTTRYHITPPRNLLELYEDENMIVGMRDNILTRLLKIDLDAPSPYHSAINHDAYNRLRQILEDVGLVRHSIVQSSFSGGLHLYIALPSAIPSWLAAHALTTLFLKNGFILAKGVLEIFPNRTHFNATEVTSFNGIRLPLQPNSGSIVLDTITLEPLHASLSRFVQELDMDAAHQDIETFKRFMQAAYEDFRIDIKGRLKSRNGRAKAWLADLLARVNAGWTGDAQTNDLILEAMKVVYIFHKRDGQQAVTDVATWLRSLPGYEQYCGHKHDLEKRCWDWLKCVSKLYYPYTKEFRERQGINYGSAIRGTTKKVEDGRRHNKANTERHQGARNKLAAIIWRLRGLIRSGAVHIPETIRGLIDLVSATTRQHFGKGFGTQFLHQCCKRLLGKLKAYAARVVRVVNPAPEVKENLETLKPAPEAVFRAIDDEIAPPEIVVSRPRSGVPGYFTNNEGGREILEPYFPMFDNLHASLVAFWREAGTVLQFTGTLITGVVEIVTTSGSGSILKRVRVAKRLLSGTLVTVTAGVHTPQAGLVSVKPLNAKWLTGIAVPIKFLTPVSS